MGIGPDVLLNSFVPNLVWLPSDLAKLSDRIGGFTQRLLQCIALRVYSGVVFPPELQRYVDASWARLPAPRDAPAVPETPLSYFALESGAYRRQAASLREVVLGVADIAAGRHIERVYSRRYAPGLRQLAPEKLQELVEFLRPYVELDERES